MNRIYTDTLIIGSGLSGLSTALSLADKGVQVLLVTKEKIDTSNSANAQGGIASVVDFSTDSFNKHMEDTIVAGCGLNKPDVVKFFVEKGPESVNYFKNLGCRFSQDNYGHLDLGKEGGHTARRVVHAGDMTGLELIRSVKQAVLKHTGISVLENHTAVDLISTSKFMLSDKNRVIGAYVLDDHGEVLTIVAKAVLVATGGCGKVYLYTSNPGVTSGDGLAIGFRAGIPAVNMEMIQFHPTILYHEKATSVLISEALRGEGGILITKNGVPFMDNYHRQGSLAPRDIVARAIDYELKKSGDDCVFLDMTSLDRNFLIERFPNLFKICIDVGIDMSNDPIPVVPAAHYMCGGLKSSPSGKTDIPGLFLSGEVAHTGLHGANRLASNSLLEAAVMSKHASKEILTYFESYDHKPVEPPLWSEETVVNKDENVILKQNWDEIRRFMWNYVGIVRSDKRLRRALARLELIKQEIYDYYWNFKISRDLLELRNITLVSEIIIKSAIKRKESRGLHYNIDYPCTIKDAVDTEVIPEEIF